MEVIEGKLQRKTRVVRVFSSWSKRAPRSAMLRVRKYRTISEPRGNFQCNQGTAFKTARPVELLVLPTALPAIQGKQWMPV